MPKGDIETLKADTEDGYTKIANLIIEALAMCKLSGTQHGICLFLFRRTYGWGKTEDSISLPEFAAACDTSQPYVSRQIKDLLEKNIVIRIDYQPGKTPTYTFNTRVAEWDKGCINIQGLSEQIRQGLYDCARVGLSDCARVNQPPALEPPKKEPPLKKELKKKKEIIMSPDEFEFVSELEKIDSYPVEREKDLEMYKTLAERYPEVDLINAVKDWRIHKLSDPLKPKQNARSQLNTWCQNAQKWGKNKKKQIEREGPEFEYPDNW